MRTERPDANGFSLVEVMIAMVILTVGVLALVGLTWAMTVQVRVADIRTERMAVLQHQAERLRSLHFDSVSSRGQSQAVTLSGYQVWWNSTDMGNGIKRLEVISRGAGYRRGWVQDAQDSLSFTIIEE